MAKKNKIAAPSVVDEPVVIEPVKKSKKAVVPAEPVKKGKAVAAAKPAAKKKTTETLSTAWLAEQVNLACGTKYDPAQLRILLRKLTKDGVVERGEGRYEFTGVEDPRVVAVIAAVKDGSADEAKKARLADLKAKREAAKAAAPAKGKKGKKAAPVVEDDEEIDLDEV